MIRTQKLYDEDSHLYLFTATVLSCECFGDNYAAVLDRTAFFPEGGGQSADKGTLDNAEVLDVQMNESGIITHVISAPLAAGSTVTGLLDFNRRFAFMQNHSGEHIVSGIVHRLFGLDNVGFHLAEDFVTLDFNGELSREQLDDIELRANRAVWSNADIRAYYPDEGTLKALNYRSKKELEGDIRIVEIEGTDICACCAPHVKKTGEIGMIKLLDTEKMRGGTRIVMKCGEFAVKDYSIKYDNIKQISSLLSAKQEETACAVKKLEVQLNEAKLKARELKKRLIERIVTCSNPEEKVLFEEGLDIKELQLLSDALYKKHGGIRGVFSGSDGSFAFAACGQPQQLDEFFAEFKQKFPVRGGGRNGMVQGTVTATAENIKLCF